MSEAQVLQATHGPVRVLTRNRPAALNSFTAEMHGQLLAALNAAAPMEFGDALALEARLQRELGHAHDFAEGLAALKARRAPLFTDR